MTSETTATKGSTVDPAEAAKFAAMAEAWWDPDGDFKPLHQLNPTRLAYIRDTLCSHFKLGARDTRPLDGLSVLDIGCGGGLVSEPMKRLGADVIAIDAEARNIAIAQAHARTSDLDIDYRNTTAEDLIAAPERFDAVLALEIIEHVSDIPLFVESCATLTKPGGILIMSTINRTMRSLALAKIGAEYILRWLPRGTHDWRRFVKPSEAARALRRQDLAVRDITGMSYDPIGARWRLSADMSVNYFISAEKPG